MLPRILVIVQVFLLVVSCRPEVIDDLAREFRDPPSYTRPWVYWYWIDENITRDGITKDLEAMARVGIGEALIGHVSPGETRGDVPMLSDEWWNMVKYAVREGQRLGVDIGFFNGPGWSQSGGPWIKADQSMRYVVNREIRVQGPARFKSGINYPDANFQLICIQAFRLPEIESGNIVLKPERISSYPDTGQIRNLIDDNPNTTYLFPDKMTTADSLIIDIKMKDEVILQSIRFDQLPVSFKADFTLEIPDSTGNFMPVTDFSIDRRNIQFEIGPERFDPVVLAIPPTLSGRFRLVLKNLVKSRGAGLKDIYLKKAARVDHVIEKELGKMSSDPVPSWDTYLWKDQTEPLSGSTINPDRIIDISDRIDSAGILTWDVPEGNWLILQSGMIPTGATNVPVPPEARGYECDKFSKAAIETHFNAFIGKFLEMVPEKERKSLKTVVIDSYEVGPQNWIDDFRNIFKTTYGYDPVPWLPVLTGRIVDSAEKSNRFLWDLRRLSADLIANNYVNRLRELSNQHGLQLWEENYGHWGFPAEFLQYGGRSDLVSGEFWFQNPIWDLGTHECRGAASAAHIYGKKEVFAEAFTAGFSFRQYPAIMKTRGDRMYCEGINHFVLHVYIHQPWQDKIPGVTAWFGMNFNRHNTWFEQSRAWNEYFMRCHYLLQQGLPVSDICYFIGEDTPKMTGILDPPLPVGYDYDLINADVIMNRLAVRNGKLSLPDGKTYRIMVLPPQKTIRPELLHQIRQLIKDGAVVYGPPPEKSPSLAGFPACDSLIREMAQTIWQDTLNKPVLNMKFGKGKVFFGEDLRSVLREIKISPDVIYNDSSILWTHRKTDVADIYFISNQRDQKVQTEISFRIKNRIPEFWYPETGQSVESLFFVSKNERTIVPVNLEPTRSLFVIFRHPVSQPSIVSIEKNSKIQRAPGNDIIPGEFPDIIINNDGTITVISNSTGKYSLLYANGHKREIEISDIPPDLKITGPWEVSFEKEWNAPEKTRFDSLISWSDHPDAGIRYYSGTAVYQKDFNLPAQLLQKDLNLTLNLCKVMVIAEVALNGKNLGILWDKPFSVDISEDVKTGKNHLEIRVVNTWWNRLIGDARYPEGLPGKNTAGNKTFTTFKSWSATDTLMDSGLLGPVRIGFFKKISIR